MRAIISRRRSCEDAGRCAAASRREDWIAALLCTALVVCVGLLASGAARAQDAAASPLRIEREPALFYAGDAARVSVGDGELSPFVSAGGGERRWNPERESLRQSSTVPGAWLAGVAAGLSLQVADPLALRLAGGWAHDVSRPPARDTEAGFGTASAQLELRF